MLKPRGLLGLTGITLSGGIVAVNRTIARALDEEMRAGRLERVDRLLLMDHEVGPAPVAGSQWAAGESQTKFALRLYFERWRRKPDWMLFDLLGVARAAQIPLPVPPAPYIIFCHGKELSRATPGTPHRKALFGASRLIANSETTAGYVHAEFPELSDRVRVAPLCIDPGLTEAWQALGIDGSGRAELSAERRRAPVVLIIGRTWSEERGKGHDELLEAWPDIRTAIPGAQFWIVGEGDDTPRLEAKARELGVADAVRFLGRISDAELAGAYQRASLFAMPSIQEGFGLVYAEAMWHRVPCLASLDDAGAEIVRHGETGALVPYGDVAAVRETVIRLLSDPARLEELGEAAGREARERFGYERFKRDLLAGMDLSDAR